MSEWLHGQQAVYEIDRETGSPSDTHHFPQPLLLIPDGYESHKNIDIINILVENEVHLYHLPPQASNILQACVVAVFRPLKAYFTCLKDMVKLAFLGTANHIY